MNKQSIIVLSAIALLFAVATLFTSSCKKTHNGTSSADSGIIYFHLHTQIDDTTIGGNTDASDSNETGPGASPWYYIYDTHGPLIQLRVPQFFVSNIMLNNANGTMLTLNNVVLLKGLDSEDYYCCKVPVGTYTSAMFTVGLSSADNALPPTTQFVNDSVPYPFESGMWMGSTSMGYYGMIIKGLLDTTSGHTGNNPVTLNYQIPNSLTSANQIMLPTRGTGAYSSYPLYIVTKGSTVYVHILCDYGKLLSNLSNMTTENATDGMTLNVAVADTLASHIPEMFRYEQ